MASVAWVTVVGGLHLPGIKRREWGGPEFLLSTVQLVAGTMLILTLLGC